MFEEHLRKTIEMIQANPAIGVGIAVAVAALFFFRPKEMFKLSLFVLFMFVVFYVMSLLIEATGTGSSQKDKMIHKTREAMGE